MWHKHRESSFKPDAPSNDLYAEGALWVQEFLAAGIDRKEVDKLVEGMLPGFDFLKLVESGFDFYLGRYKLLKNKDRELDEKEVSRLKDKFLLGVAKILKENLVLVDAEARKLKIQLGRDLSDEEFKKIESDVNHNLFEMLMHPSNKPLESSARTNGSDIDEDVDGDNPKQYNFLYNRIYKNLVKE